MDNKMNILIACEESQAVTKELRRLGHEAYSCDVLNQSGGHPEWHIEGDVSTFLNGNVTFKTSDGQKHVRGGQWDMIIAFPPCTYLTNAGAARLFRDVHDGEYQMVHLERLKNGIKGRDFFMKIMNANCDHIAIENPVPSTLWCLPQPTQMIEPYEYGHPYSKRTCLWLKNLPKLQPTNIVEPQISWVSGGSKKKDGSARDNMGMKFRDSGRKSKTFPGIAKAMAEQWTTDEAMACKNGWDVKSVSIEEQFNLFEQ